MQLLPEYLPRGSIGAQAPRQGRADGFWRLARYQGQQRKGAIRCCLALNGVGATGTIAPWGSNNHRQAAHACQSPLVQRHEFLANRHTRSDSLGRKETRYALLAEPRRRLRGGNPNVVSEALNSLVKGRREPPLPFTTINVRFCQLRYPRFANGVSMLTIADAIKNGRLQEFMAEEGKLVASAP